MTTEGYQRLFFAIELSPEHKAQIAQLIKKLVDQNYGEINWTSAEKMHLTLRFLGKVKRSTVIKLLPTVESSLETIDPFVIEPQSVVVMSKRHPRIIALAIIESPSLKCLFEKIEGILIDSGFKPETRRFFPHITLGRTVGGKPILPTKIDQDKLNISPYFIEKITLFSSKTLDSGSIYNVVKQIKLGRKKS